MSTRMLHPGTSEYSFAEITIKNKSGYNMYRGWGQTDYQSRHCAIDQKDEGT